MSNIILTGSTGFIGSNLLKALRALDHNVIELNRSSGNVAETATWSSLPASEIVIHLAALTFVPDSWIDPYQYIQTNLQGTICALEYCKKHKAKLIFMSSYMYGKAISLPICEEAEIKAFNPYSLSKKMAEEACSFYAENFDVKITILRPFNVYGPGQKTEFLIPSVIKQLMEGESVKVKVLEPKRDYIYIDDVIAFIIKGMQLDDKFNVFNIGTGISYSVAELIQAIQDVMKTDFPVYASGEKRMDEVLDTKADISKAAHLLNWTPEFTLKSGIAKILTLKKM